MGEADALRRVRREVRYSHASSENNGNYTSLTTQAVVDECHRIPGRFRPLLSNPSVDDRIQDRPLSARRSATTVLLIDPLERLGLAHLALQQRCEVIVRGGEHDLSVAPDREFYHEVKERQRIEFVQVRERLV